MRRNSIRNRILIFLLPLLFVVWGVFSYLIYDLTQEELEETTDSSVFQIARAIAILEGDKISPYLLDEHHDFGEKFVIIRDAAGDIIYSSYDQFVLPKKLRYGVQEVTRGETTWVLWMFPGEKTDRQYIIGTEIDEVVESLDQTITTVSFPLALVLLFSIAATVFIVKRGLRPLTDLSDTLATQEPDSLGKLSDANQPDELTPIVHSLNLLFDRIDEYLDREQQFIDDAAHEIRTPLTVVKAQCQVIKPDKLDLETKQRFENIIEGVDRASHLATKLLEHARAGQDSNRTLESQELLPVLQENLAQQAHVAQQKQIELQLLASQSLSAVFEPDDFSAILSNLVGNALRHTPASGQVIVVQEQDDTTVTIRVEDSGPGIPAEYREKVFERFFRMPGEKSIGGGLGLSIVRTLCKRNNISVSLTESEKLGGACFSLIFKK